jgi:hypothetical protein
MQSAYSVLPVVFTAYVASELIVVPLLITKSRGLRPSRTRWRGPRDHKALVLAATGGRSVARPRLEVGGALNPPPTPPLPAPRIPGPRATPGPRGTLLVTAGTARTPDTHQLRVRNTQGFYNARTQGFCILV